jgi:hypothetical protein
MVQILFVEDVLGYCGCYTWLLLYSSYQENDR